MGLLETAAEEPMISPEPLRICAIEHVGGGARGIVHSADGCGA